MITFDNGSTDTLTRDDVIGHLRYMLGNNPFTDTLELMGMWQDENGQLCEQDFDAIATMFEETRSAPGAQSLTGEYDFSPAEKCTVASILHELDKTGRNYLQDIKERTGLDDVELDRELRELELSGVVVLYSINEGSDHWPKRIKEGFSVVLYEGQPFADQRRILYVTNKY